MYTEEMKLRAATDLPSVSLSSPPPHHLCKPQSTTEPCASRKNSRTIHCPNCVVPRELSPAECTEYVPNKGHCMTGGQGH